MARKYRMKQDEVSSIFRQDFVIVDYFIFSGWITSTYKLFTGSIAQKLICRLSSGRLNFSLLLQNNRRD